MLACTQATLFKMGQRVIAENAGVQKIEYALPNRHYIPVDMKYIGIDNTTPLSTFLIRLSQILHDFIIFRRVFLFGCSSWLCLGCGWVWWLENIRPRDELHMQHAQQPRKNSAAELEE